MTPVEMMDDYLQKSSRLHEQILVNRRYETAALETFQKTGRQSALNASMAHRLAAQKKLDAIERLRRDLCVGPVGPDELS